MSKDRVFKLTTTARGEEGNTVLVYLPLKYKHFGTKEVITFHDVPNNEEDFNAWMYDEEGFNLWDEEDISDFIEFYQLAYQRIQEDYDNWIKYITHDKEDHQDIFESKDVFRDVMRRYKISVYDRLDSYPKGYSYRQVY